MRNLVTVFCLASMGCAREEAAVDTAVETHSTLVAGAPAVPAVQPPAETAKAAVKSASPAPSPLAGSTKAEGPVNSVSRPDSVRGIVSVVGTSVDKHVMIAERGTRRRVEVLGALATMIGHVAGAEVTAAGSFAGTQLNASRFVVRSVDGQPAIDGTLHTEGGALFIVTAEGIRTRISTPPPPLVGHDGARVWVTGDPALGVSSFGFIDPPR